jgi:hypothetical protein
VRGGQIHHCQLALSINNKSQAIVEDCTLTHNGHASEESESNTYAQVWAGHESEATLRRCTIRDGARDSIGLRYQSTGTVEECAIEGNARDGLWIGEQTRATIRRCRINRHKHNAITIKKDCTVVVEDCDLSGNERGAWDLPLFGVRGLRRERNEE